MNAADQISQFVSCVYLPDDFVEVRAIKDGTVRKFWRQANALVSCRPELESLNRAGWNMYVGPNPQGRWTQWRRKGSPVPMPLCRL